MLVVLGRGAGRDEANLVPCAGGEPVRCFHRPERRMLVGVGQDVGDFRGEADALCVYRGRCGFLRVSVYGALGSEEQTYRFYELPLSRVCFSLLESKFVDVCLSQNVYKSKTG